MCGIAGFISADGKHGEALVARMTARLIHRGPDGGAHWLDPETGIALGHRRLSIIDVSAQGDQPMVSASGRYVMIFNGEIFNYADLRTALEAAGAAPRWRGHSDTEVLLQAIETWGVERALQQAEGQLALALWDRLERRLHLARDRFGEKPLYWGWAGRDFVFASELKALAQHPALDRSLDPEAVASYFRYAYVPAPWSIYRDVRKLEPGALLSLDLADLKSRKVETRPYWRAADEISAGLADRFSGSEDDAVEALDARLRAIVKSRMVSDVPLGALLSGGIDSSIIVALMQQAASRPVKTFTIGSWDKALNEAEHAREVARVLGTEHTELYVGGDEALGVVPRLAEMYDEPFADSSQIPTHLVSALARRHVTVALSGDGGDELFGGYNRYIYGPAWNRLSRTPLGARRFAAGVVHAAPPAAWSALFKAAGPLAPGALRHGRAGDKLHKFAHKLTARSEASFLKLLLSAWETPQDILSGGAHGLDIPAERLPALPLGGFAERAMALDTTNYLPDDILVKVDRASMAVSLEARAPFLDSGLLRFAWSLPMEMKLKGKSGKRVLKRVLERYVPRRLFERPKAGFAVPVGTWLRSDLKDWGESLVSRERLSDGGLFDVEAVRRVWAEHQSGRRDWSARLWAVLMFQAWRDAEEGPHAGSALQSEAKRAPRRTPAGASSSN
ncbi:MAG TPA: asparagine synthase (glutamine-hydrolyzing) [Caulobacteraceae bacterium]|jgi:asparagine synthase (glutamine-hydrolysing)